VLEFDWLEVIGPPEPPSQEEWQRQRESLALWHWDDDWYENKLIRNKAWAEAKDEFRSPRCTASYSVIDRPFPFLVDQN
jgi:hypothetical protein